mgnify:CR=1 FL=1
MNAYRYTVFPNGTRVWYSVRGYWIIRNRAGKVVSRHDSREYAVTKARKMDRELEDKP